MKKKIYILISTYRSGSSAMVHMMSEKYACSDNLGEYFAVDYGNYMPNATTNSPILWWSDVDFDLPDGCVLKIQTDTLIHDKELLPKLMAKYDCHIEILYRSGLWDQVISFIKPTLAREQFSRIRVKDPMHKAGNWYHTPYPKKLLVDFHDPNIFEIFDSKVYALQQNYVEMSKHINLGPVHRYESLFEPSGRIYQPYLMPNKLTPKQYMYVKYTFNRLQHSTRHIFSFDQTIPRELIPEEYL